MRRVIDYCADWARLLRAERRRWLDPALYGRRAAGVISVASNLVVGPLVDMVAAALANDTAVHAHLSEIHPLFKPSS